MLVMRSWNTWQFEGFDPKLLGPYFWCGSHFIGMQLHLMNIYYTYILVTFQNFNLSFQLARLPTYGCKHDNMSCTRMLLGLLLEKYSLVWKNKDCPLEFDKMKKHFLFVSRFERVNFVNNGKYSKNNYDNSNYYASFVNFQTYKYAVFNLGALVK
jgi:hypothetical protein